jgi:catechol 2,3-dioxygenase-like lactoylglutathione lyase family enzyme
MSSPPRIERLDHLVLTVTDVAATVAFYRRVLGFAELAYGDQRIALVFGSHKINLHPLGSAFEPRAARPAAGSADLCFVTSDAIEEVVEHVRACDVTIVEGPVRRTGALGPMTSVYVRDPDGNLIEIARYE